MSKNFGLIMEKLHESSNMNESTPDAPITEYEKGFKWGDNFYVISKNDKEWLKNDNKKNPKRHPARNFKSLSKRKYPWSDVRRSPEVTGKKLGKGIVHEDVNSMNEEFYQAKDSDDAIKRLKLFGKQTNTIPQQLDIEFDEDPVRKVKSMMSDSSNHAVVAYGKGNSKELIIEVPKGSSDKVKKYAYGKR